MPINPLRDLLSQAMQRARVSTQVTAAQVVSVVNEIIWHVLGPSRHHDARALSYRKEILTIEVRNASAGQFLREHEVDVLRQFHERFSYLKVRTVRYRVVHRFRRSEL